MNPTVAGVLSLLTVVATLAVLHVPLGAWMHRVFTSAHHTRAERAVYRLAGIDPDTEQRWWVYALSVIALSVVSIVMGHCRWPVLSTASAPLHEPST